MALPQKWTNIRLKTPTVIQMEAVECGAASLAMILAHFRRFTPLEELRVACGISRDGSKASNILKAARNYGLEARGFRGDIADLHDHPLPMILFWNFNHFVVLEGIKGDTFFLNDPAVGPRKVDRSVFDQSFTGIILTFTPTSAFVPGGRPPSVMRALRRRLDGYGTALGFILLTGALLTFPSLLIPMFNKIFVDDILLQGISTWIWPLIWLMLITAATSGALIWLQQTHFMRMELKLSLTGSTTYLRHLLRLPADFFMQRYPGDISSRVELNDKLSTLLATQLGSNIVNLPMLVFFVAVMAVYDITLTAVGVGIITINLFALQFVARKRKDLSKRVQHENGKMLGISMNGLQMIETLKANGSESDYFSSWAGHQAKYVMSQQELSSWTQTLAAVPILLTALNTTAILGVGGFRIMEGTLTIGLLLAFQGLMAAFLAPVTQLVNLGSQIQETQADLIRLDDVIHHPEDALFTNPAPQSREPEASLTRLTGRLELVEVSFGYSRLDPPLIENFSLSLKPGSRIALVGGSGSGKSTVAKLVTGLYKPWTGEVLLDGTPLLALPRPLVTSSVAKVDQETIFFEDTIQNNLTLWDDSIPRSDVTMAARDACIHDDIAIRSGGYQSMVREGGRNFSGGQRQRLEIARALARGPSLLVMDEATSALDAETEKLVDTNLRRRGCACLIIAHRLSTIRDSDEIIVLDKGSVVERGNHEQLMNLGGTYAALIRTQ